jgi:hypothetical protein
MRLFMFMRLSDFSTEATYRIVVVRIVAGGRQALLVPEKPKMSAICVTET